MWRMAQFVVYGHRQALTPRISLLSDAIHAAAIAVLELPADKRFHRFISLDPHEFITPSDRTVDYTIIEVSMFAGRSTETRKKLLRALISNVSAVGIAPHDLEITLTETPRENWGVRGLPADELSLNYAIDV